MQNTQTLSNLGRTNLRKRRRAGDPMRHFDTLPPELRNWLAHAALPWSPAATEKLFRKLRKAGLSADAALLRLSAAEAQTLRRAGGPQEADQPAPKG